MSVLISSKEAKLAWANDEIVEFRCLGDKWYENWTNLLDAKNGFSSQEFDSIGYEFRIKPKTIVINNTEFDNKDSAIDFVKECFSEQPF